MELKWGGEGSSPRRRGVCLSVCLTRRAADALQYSVQYVLCKRLGGLAYAPAHIFINKSREDASAGRASLPGHRNKHAEQRRSVAGDPWKFQRHRFQLEEHETDFWAEGDEGPSARTCRGLSIWFQFTPGWRRGRALQLLSVADGIFRSLLVHS